MKIYNPVTFLLVLFTFLVSNFLGAQTTVSGTVKATNGTALEGVNVYLQGTYDGSTTDATGRFSFETSEEGIKTIIASYISFETLQVSMEVTKMTKMNLILKEDLNSLDTVVISAGTFEASDNSKVSVLKPLDVVTTASALGDFVGALQTLPGTTTVAEDGRLFVRGGDAGETQIFIDGIRVFSPYSPTTNNIPTRGRYSPFLFDGITFSTGGYSAEYGQALSSILLLNTIDEPVQEETNISLMTVGGGVGTTKKWKKSSLSLSTSYINLAPYNEVFPDRNDWEKPYEALAGEAVFRQQFDKGLLKIYTAFDTTHFKLTQEDIQQEDGLQFSLKNQNLYTNTSYSGKLSSSLHLFAGGSFTFSKNKLGIEESTIDNTDHSAHLKLKLRKRFSSRFKLSVGAEQFSTRFSETYQENEDHATYGFKNPITAAFSEADIIFSRKFALKLGVRGEYSSLFSEFTVAPRISFAYKTTKNSQLSVAYGDFYQQPGQDILKFEKELTARKTQHYILNYQYIANDRIFRAEAYRKEYSNLITYNTTMPQPNSSFSNNGDGYAQGVDIFFRDNKSVKNIVYWASYSYLDTQRKHLNFPEKTTPSFASTHTLSLVGKYWIENWKSQVGVSYQYGSGRTYTNPNKAGFLQEKTRNYNDLSVNWAYLISQQQILYLSVNNIAGFNNINGYQYANTPDGAGNFDRRALRPAADQFFFIGFFWTFSDDKTKNQLDTL